MKLHPSVQAWGKIHVKTYERRTLPIHTSILQIHMVNENRLCWVGGEFQLHHIRYHPLFVHWHVYILWDPSATHKSEASAPFSMIKKPDPVFFAWAMSFWTRCEGQSSPVMRIWPPDMSKDRRSYVRVFKSRRAHNWSNYRWKKHLERPQNAFIFVTNANRLAVGNITH